MSKNDIVVDFEDEKDIDVKFDKPYQKYNAGYGINISNKTISVDDEVIASKEYVNEEIGKLDFYGKEEVDSKLAEKQDTIIAGQDIVKNGNTISVDRTYIDTQIASAKDYTNKMIAKVVYGDIPTNQVDYFGYQNQVPQGIMPYASLLKIGGMSYKINQLVQNGNFSDSTGWGGSNTTLSVNNNIATITATINSQYCGLTKQNMQLIQGHKYFISYNFNPSGNFRTCIYNGDSVQGQTNTTANINNKINTIFTQNNNFYYILIYLNYSGSVIGDYAKISEVQLFDLTAMGIDTTDVATATSELLKRGIDINEYQAYDSGSIRDSAVPSVVSKDSNDTTIDTFTIDSNIQALNGYGWGINENCYNYIGFENKKFVQKVGKYNFTGVETWAIQSGSAYIVLTDLGGKPNSTNCLTDTPNVSGKIGTSNSNIIALLLDTTVYDTSAKINEITSGKVFYYELATPIETDISEYIDNNFIEVEPNGSLITENEYKQYVPSSILYIEEEE